MLIISIIRYILLWLVVIWWWGRIWVLGLIWMIRSDWSHMLNWSTILWHIIIHIINFSILRIQLLQCFQSFLKLFLLLSLLFIFLSSDVLCQLCQNLVLSFYIFQ